MHDILTDKNIHADNSYATSSFLILQNCAQVSTLQLSSKTRELRTHGDKKPEQFVQNLEKFVQCTSHSNIKNHHKLCKLPKYDCREVLGLQLNILQILIAVWLLNH